jgi:hypothetical protein
LGPDVSGGATYPFFESFAYFEDCVALATGGRRTWLRRGRRPAHCGGEIRTDAEIRRVLTDDERAIGVELTSGE